MWDFREFNEFLKDTGKYILVIALVFLIFMFVISFQGIVGNSMAPALNDNEMVIVSKLTPRIFSLKRNDVVSLKSPDGKVYVKRIIGLPGEEIHYLNNTLYINGSAYTENFLSNNVTTNNFLLEDVCSNVKCNDNKIPDNYYLVLGDNRNDSLDSRDKSLGLVPKNNIIGKIILRFWPINKFSKI